MWMDFIEQWCVFEGEKLNSDESPKTTTIIHFPLDEKFMKSRSFIAVSVLLFALISFFCAEIF